MTVRGSSRGMIALAAAALVVLSGCGGGTGTPAADGVSADPSSVSLTENAVPAAAEKTPAAGAKKKKAKAAAKTPAKTTATPKPSPKPSRTVRPQPPKAVKPKVTPKPAKPKAPAADTPAEGMTEIELKVLELTNAERAKAGCTALRGDAKLALAARRHSTDMGENGYFDHNSQDGSTPWDRIKKAGYMSPGAENIAAGQPTAAAVMDGWMKSPGHKANILNCKLKALGVGYYKGTKGYRTYWTQDFGFA